MRVFILLFGLLTSTFASAQSFPVLGPPVDSKAYQLGTGSCSTERNAVWSVPNGIVIEVKKPSDCLFKDGALVLVVGEDRLPMVAVDDSFNIKTFGNGKSEYRWRKSSGKLLFKSSLDKPLDLSEIKGILEPTCSDTNCLNEASAQSK